MAKNSVSDWSGTASDNTDVGGIDISEGCPAANINDAIREVMAQIAQTNVAELDEVAASADEINILDGATITTEELNNVQAGDENLDGLSDVTSAENRVPRFTDDSGSMGFLNFRDETGLTSEGSVSIPSQRSVRDYVDTGRGYTWKDEVSSNGATQVDFFEIPEWVTDIIIVQSGFTWTSSAATNIVIGDIGGFENSGYRSNSSTVDGPGGVSGVRSSTTAFTSWGASSASNTWRLSKPFSGNTWVCEFNGLRDTLLTHSGAGSKTLSGTLTRVRVMSEAGAGTFSSGTVNIGYR